MTVVWYSSIVGNDGLSYTGETIDSDTGQLVKNYYASTTEIAHTGTVIKCQIRGLTNLRGKDAGTIQNYGNRLDDYDFVRVHTADRRIKAGDIFTRMLDADGNPYNKTNPNQAYVVLGLTPTYDPFGGFVENIVSCNKSSVAINV